VHCPEQGFPPAAARTLLGPDALVGVSCHSMASVRGAAESGASFVFFGPVYETPTKVAYGTPAGLDALRSVCAESALPVFAIGGVTPVRATECIDAGAHGVAVIRSVLANDDIASPVRSFEEALGGL
jgi:thiamine-phosphate pyrophosphorylase